MLGRKILVGLDQRFQRLARSFVHSLQLKINLVRLRDVKNIITEEFRHVISQETALAAQSKCSAHSFDLSALWLCLAETDRAASKCALLLRCSARQNRTEQRTAATRHESHMYIASSFISYVVRVQLMLQSN